MPKIVRITAAGLERLIEDLKKVQLYPTTPCLNNQEIAFYMVDGDTPGNHRDKEAIEAHTASCTDCCDKLCFLYEIFGESIKFCIDTESDWEPIYQRILNNLAAKENRN